MDNPHDHRIILDDPPPTPSETELLAAMEQSERDVAAGLTVPLADVLADLADEIEAGRYIRPV